MRTVSLVAVFAPMFVAGTVVADESGSPTEVRFNEHIRPILSDHCFACHGPDDAARETDLRLDRREDAMASGVIVIGNASQSELIARITSSDPDEVMPPPEFQKKLTAEHKQLLALWVDSGAKWEEHWAFLPPFRVALPQPTDADGWIRNPIDHFVLKKLHELELEPNEEADRYTLARRAALDVTGLPPTTQRVESFVNDTEPQAYERYVASLLTVPHAGEHRARHWLDAARYGDTHGMHVDNYREIWPYRDWVVRAFNSNMPFDRFVVEQIAGDLLPEPTFDQLVATGFNRCNITTAEGGAIPEEVNVRYMVDRVETTATVFLGLTAGCAVCHNHKYDPITQKEFYQLGAFFNNTTQPAMDGNQKDTPPVIALPREEFQDEWGRLQIRRRQLRSELNAWKSGASEWWTIPSETRAAAAEHPVSSDGLILWLPLAEGVGEPVELPGSALWATDHPVGQRGVRFGEGGEISVDLPQLRTDEPLTISFWFRTPDRLMSTTLFDQKTVRKVEVAKKKEDKKDESGEEKEIVEHPVGWKITSSTQGALRFEFSDGQGGKISGNLPGEEALKPRSWQHVCVRYSGGQANSSINILTLGKSRMLRNASEQHIAATELVDVPLKIGTLMPTAGLSDIRIFRRWLTDEEVRLLSQDHTVRQLVASEMAWDELDDDDRGPLVSFHRNAVDQNFRERAREFAASQTRRDYIYARSTTTLVMEERSTPPRAWVLERGEYDQRGEEVEPNVPAVLPGLPEGAARNRVGLAQWLVRPDHPLTGRVYINRLWQSLFGTGLVKTAEDFGVMGERPSHRELLDWLSVEFVESGWDVHHMIRLMLSSAAYRQASRVSPEKFHKDPENRFLARGPRLRLDAEVLRDQALAVSGILNRKIGGPGVRPYQPAGLWRVVAITGSNTRQFVQDTGDSLYRRSLYTFWKRTSPPPSMAAFNAPTREQCTVRRERTNTPLQALVLMNDPQFVETARRLAEDSLRSYQDHEERAAWMLSTVLTRPASAADKADVVAAAADFRAIFAKNPDAAKELSETGDSVPDETLDVVELGVWTMVANTLMNRDDFINKN